MAAEAATGSLQEQVMVWIEHHTMANPDVWHPLPFMNIPLPGFLSLHAVMLLLCGLFLVIIFGVLYRKRDEVPCGWTNFLELFICFVRDEICIPNIGEADGRRMTPLFCSFFFFILGLNMMGLIPLFSTATGNISVTLGLASITLFFMIGGGIYRNGFGGFFKSLIPHGVPWPIAIILFPIEMVGLLVKPFALTIRLFANMLAGHIVLFSLISLAVVFGMAAAVPAVLMGAGIYLLEIFVALLQAYIFTMLSAMFVGACLHPAH